MPADYNSTARALSLPISPPQSPTRQPLRTSWSRSQSNIGRTRTHSPYAQRGQSFRDRATHNAIKLQRQVFQTVRKLSTLQKILGGFVLIALFVLTILFFVYNESIFHWLEPFAEKWKNLPAGWLILWFMTVVVAFPPLIGYSTCVTIAGFVYGFPVGWFIVASANIVGSTLSFIVSRTILSKYVNRLVANNSQFAALSLVLKHDGLKLLVMIRLCPLPYSISNGAISTFPTVQPLMFALATAIASPKLLIHVFIGSRMRAIARSGEKMDTTTKIINWVSIVGGIILGAVTGWLIYRQTVARSRQLEAEERSKARQAPHRSHSRSFSDDPNEDIEDTAAATLQSDDDIDFLAVDGAGDEYRDEFDAEHPDAFRFEDEDADAIDLDKQPPRRGW